MPFESRETNIAKSTLVREVLSPGREQTGIAVVLVAASALAFALAGSAFALWARSSADCDHSHSYNHNDSHSDNYATTTVDADSHPPLPCSSQVVEHNNIAYYRVCADPKVAIHPAHEVEIEEQEGIVVYRIIK